MRVCACGCVREHMTGVALRTRHEGAAVRRHVHCAGDGWRVTSAVPVTAALLDATPLDACFPGALGRYPLPDDAVFHVVGQRRTACADLDETIRRETMAVRTNAVVHHLTVAATAEWSKEEEEEELVARAEEEEASQSGSDSEEADDDAPPDELDSTDASDDDEAPPAPPEAEAEDDADDGPPAE